MHKILTLVAAVLMLGALASTASATTFHAGICGDTIACPSHASGYLSLANGRRAVAAELVSENLPMATSITGCSRKNRAEIECGITTARVAYGCLAGDDCSPPQTIPSQPAVMFARRIGRRSVLVWYGPGKPEGINYVVRV
jgi:hypothetical protein